jgi:hypothetical protein
MMTPSQKFVLCKTPIKPAASQNKRKMAVRGRPFEPGNNFGNRFRPGESGNPGVRPKIVRDAYAKTLEEKVKAKVADPNDPDRKKQIVKELTRAELIALTWQSARLPATSSTERTRVS